MCHKIRCDGESRKLFSFHGELNKATVVVRAGWVMIAAGCRHASSRLRTGTDKMRGVRSRPLGSPRRSDTPAQGGVIAHGHWSSRRQRHTPPHRPAPLRLGPAGHSRRTVVTNAPVQGQLDPYRTRPVLPASACVGRPSEAAQPQQRPTPMRPMPDLDPP